MAKKQKFVGVKRAYINWHGMLDTRTHNKPEVVQAYFLGFWTAFTVPEAVHFLTLCNKKDFKTMMNYPIWQ